MKKLLPMIVIGLMLTGCSLAKQEVINNSNDFDIKNLQYLTGYFDAEMKPNLDERIKTLEDEVRVIKSFKNNYFSTINHYEMLTDCPTEKEVPWAEVKDLDVHFCSEPYLKLFTRYVPKES